MKPIAGETVLLKTGNVLRWVRLVHVGNAQGGMQRVTYQVCDQYGRSKPQRATLGAGAKIEWIA